ncbi:Os01g0235632 [Oryza sativa Japonica Group]|uniref:Os01g0235632 protein n=1 Tax=Oryza sativa subsp. japonica TaxID=39947 RepID=A0A0P0V0K4_ORYSJ|nr:hypothetical protein EE612_001313 [Oryza sativa]BAS71224.1 Os01g0235632 [Oryza sativa Japonica Group]
MLEKTSLCLSPDQCLGHNPPRQHLRMLSAIAAAHACASSVWPRHYLQKQQVPSHHHEAHGKSHPPIQGQGHRTLCATAARIWHSSNQHQDDLIRQAPGVYFASPLAKMQQQGPRIWHHLLLSSKQKHPFQAHWR